ncbi:unnamed protein product [Medioppia subpectinata]|uniref:Uncharacterized protein n=1 Tax=Medioppia subpectinata TaxID=1979941 RepID=A0A7R9Q5Y9_9ACAR|nr:unnamed protein product [Medioppia subpectinata]CAG2112728.1 unnamed protein product [Medioppia subpectinata]
MIRVVNAFRSGVERNQAPPALLRRASLDIRVVNAFRSGVERNQAPPALLRRAAQLKSQSLDAGSSTFPPSQSSQAVHQTGGAATAAVPPKGPLSTSASLDEKDKQQELRAKRLPKGHTITDSNQSVETSV